MKKLCLLCLIIFLTGCSLQGSPGQPDTSEELRDEYNIIGEYTCMNDFYDQYKDRPDYDEYIPSISFYEDGMCRFRVYYIGGVTNLNGVYKIEEDSITVNLDMKNTIMESPADGSIQYMDDQYVFKIADEDNLIIDRECYIVNADDLFVKTSSEPAPVEPDPEYDILGKYICSSEKFIGTDSYPVPYIKFYKEGHCEVYVGLSQEDKYYVNESDERYEITDSVFGKYYFEENRIHITDLRFLPIPTEVDHPLLDVMQDNYVCTIIDEDHITIDNGFYNVSAGDTFVREK